MKEFLRISGIIVLVLVSRFVFAQPNSTYNLKAGGTSITLTSQAVNTTSQCEWGFLDGATSYFATLANCNSSTFGATPKSTETVAPGIVGNVHSITYEHTCYTTITSPSTGLCHFQVTGTTVDNTITVNTLADLTSTSSFPTNVCQNGTTYNLYNYINLSSGVTFTVDGSATSSTLNPASFGTGVHTLGASYAFDNGTTTISLGSFTVYSLAAITGNPSSSTVCQNQTASFTASGSGYGVTYQWQYNTGSGFANVPAGAPYSNTTTGTLGINPVTSTMSGYQFQMVVSNLCNTVTSSGATLGTYGQISVTSSPSNVSVCPGSTASFTTGASGGDGSITYQWQHSSDGGATFNNTSNGVGTNGTISGVTTSTLSISSILLPYSGYKFRCVLSDGCPGNVDQNVTSSASVTVYAAPAVSIQPINKSFCLNGGTSMNVVASASNGTLLYQWQVSIDGGSTWSNLSNAGTYSGVTTSTLSFSSLTATYSGYKYRVLLTDNCGVSNQTISSVATLTQYGNVSITTQPSNSSICPGTGTTFSTAATGPNGSISYQWQVSTDAGTTYNNVTNTGVYTNATTATLTITGATLSMSGYKYKAIAQDGCGAVSEATSNAGTLTVYSPPSITTQPASSNYCLTGNASFSVVASASTGSLSYQWQVSADGGGTWNILTNVGVYSGTTTATLSLTGITATYSGYKYRMLLTDNCGVSNQTTSNTATLTQYANVAITTQPINKGICPGSGTTFTTTATGGNGAASFQWQVSTDGGTTFNNASNAGVYSGATTATLSITGATLSMNGYKYKAIAQDGCGAVSQATTSVVTLTVYTGASITTQPVNTTICQGTNASYSVVGAASNGTLNYQWWVNPGTGTFVTVGSTGVYSGITSATLTLNNPPTTYGSYQFYVVVSDACSSLPVQSSTATLNYYTTLPVTTAPQAQTVCSNAAAAFSIVASANTGSILYQWQVNSGSGYANVPPIAPYGTSGTTANLNISSAALSMNGYLYRVIVKDGCGASTQYTSSGVLLTVNNTVTISSDLSTSTTPCVNGAMTLSVTASGAGLVYQWQENSGAGWANLANIGPYSGVFTNQMKISAVPPSYNGYQYRLQINGSCSSTSSTVTTVSVITSPTVTSDPITKTVCAGTSVGFSVSASGTSPQYQWQYSASGSVGTFTDISGATSSTYTISNPAAGNAGYYLAKAYNTCGSNLSNSAQLTVNPITTIATQPVNGSVCPLGATSFTVAVAGTTPFSYAWQVSTNSGNTYSALTNTTVYSGASSATLSMTSIPTSYNGYQYQVVVSGTCGAAVTSSASVLTVNPTPSAPTVPAPSICGTGQIAATASSGATTPTYNWYLNQSDIAATYMGATYTITSLSTTTTYYATVVSLGCESAKQSVAYTVNTPSSVGLGAPLTLCINQGKYDLTKDIVQSNSIGGTFSWSDANNVTYTGNFFDPTIGNGTYTVSYTPPTSVQTPPNCYIISQRTVTVISNTGSNGISFLAPTGSPTVNSGNYINMCAGDPSINLSDYVTPTGGTWTTTQGNGISGNGSNVLFTASTNNLTSPSVPNIFSYSVSINGCTGSNTLSFFVSTNVNTPAVSGLAAVVCPQTKLTLTASVSGSGTYGFNWYNDSNALVGTDASFAYKVVTDTLLYVRSVNTPFGCLSSATLVNVVTPFSSGLIGVDKSSIAYGDKVDFTYTGSTNGISYLWNFGDGGFPSTDQNPEHPFYKSGTFTVNLTLTSTLNCSKTISYSSVVVAGPDVNVITGDTGPQYHGLNVFPIPVKDQLSITSENSLYTVTVYDLQGRPLVVKECAGLYETSISTGSLASGMYILLVQDSKSIKSVKIVRE